MKNVMDKVGQLLGLCMVICLVLMVVLVFGNVTLRYGFKSSITVSEELSRWLFVWMIFIGGVLALKDRQHLGTDFLTARLGAMGRRICASISYAIMIAITAILLKGMVELTRISYTSTSTVMEVSMGWFFASGVFFAVLALMPLSYQFFRIVTGQAKDQELIGFQESEETLHQVNGPKP
jgi:TRAP-type transport system small permease protein